MGANESCQGLENNYCFSRTFDNINEISNSIPFILGENNYFNDQSINDFQNQRDKEIQENIEKDILKLICKNAGESEEKETFTNFNIINNLNEIKLPFQEIKIEEEKQEKEKEKEKEKIKNFEIFENLKMSQKSTEDNTNLNQININKLIFDVKGDRKIELRIDYAIKHIKVYISKFMKNYGNDLIKKCNFQNQFKNTKLFSPSYYYFTGNSNIKDNGVFLDYTVEQIFTCPEKISPKKDNRLQRQNKEIINDLKNYIETNYPNEVPERFQELLNFFRMKYEDIINIFYNSSYFKDYSSSLKTIKLNRQFIKAKGFSLIENNGFIKLMKKSEKDN